MKIYVVFFCIFSLCGFSDLSSQSISLDVETNNSNWNLSISSNATIKAFNPSSQIELLIEFGNILPSSPYCVSNKRMKDIGFNIQIYKKAKKGDRNWEKSFEKTRVYFSGRGKRGERRVYASNLIKNNVLAKEGVVYVGTLTFLSPITCQNIDHMNVRITGMKDGGRSVDSLDFTIKLKN